MIMCHFFYLEFSILGEGGVNFPPLSLLFPRFFLSLPALRDTPATLRSVRITAEQGVSRPKGGESPLHFNSNKRSDYGKENLLFRHFVHRDE